MKYLPLLFLVLISLGAATNFNSCQTFLVPDTYTLTQDLVYNGSCLNVQTGLVPLSQTVIDCQGHSITGNESGAGILIQNSDNVTLQNCNISHNYDNVQIVGSSNGIIQNNELFHDNDAGINFYVSSRSSNWLVQNNTIHGSTYDYGIACDNLTSSIIQNNYIYDIPGIHGTGRAISGGYYCSNNVFQYNRFNNGTTGVRLNGGSFQEDNNSFIGNNITNMTNYGILIFLGSLNTTMVNNTFDGIALESIIQQPATTAECNNVVTGNIAHGYPIYYYNDSVNINGLTGGEFILCNADNSNFTNLDLRGDANLIGDAFQIYQSNGLYLENVSMENTHFGFVVSTSTNSIFNNTIVNTTISAAILTPNTVTNFTFNGVDISNIQGSNGTHIPAFSIGAINSTYNNIVVRDCNNSNIINAFNLRSTSTGDLINNASVYNCGYGIEIISGTNNTLKNIYVENSLFSGVLINSTSSGTKSFVLDNITLAKSGGFPAATFGITDSVAASEQYTIDIANSIPSILGGAVPFNNAVLNISAINRTMNFTSFNMSWADYLTALYDENSINLYQYNGTGWTLLNNTPDTTNNVISYTSPVLTAGTSNLYGLLANASNCPILGISGTYYQPISYTDAINPSSPYLNYDCVDIRVPDVVWDCQGNNITNIHTAPQTIGILAAANSISIRNCNIQNYSYNIYAVGGNLGVYQNNFTGQNADVGVSTYLSSYPSITRNNFYNLNSAIIHFFGTDHASDTDNNFYNISIRAIDGGSSVSSNFDSNYFDNSNIAITGTGITDSTIRSNTITNGGFVQLQLYSSNNLILSNNTILNSYQGMDAGSCSNMTFSQNIINNTITAIGTSAISNSIFENNYLNYFSNSISIEGSNLIFRNNDVGHNSNSGLAAVSTTSQSNTYSNNSIHENAGTGLSLGAGHNLVENNSFLTNSNVGVSITTGLSNTINSNTITNSQRGIFDLASYTVVSNNIIQNNTEAGIFTFGAFGSEYLNNSVSNDVNGIYVYDIASSDNLTIQGNTISSNTNTGIRFNNGAYALIDSNILDQNANGLVLHVYAAKETHDITVSNNNMTNQAQNAFEIGQHVENVSVSHNIINYNTQNGILASGSFQNVEINNNTIEFNNGGLNFCGANNINIHDNSIDQNAQQNINFVCPGITNNNTIANNIVSYSGSSENLHLEGSGFYVYNNDATNSAANSDIAIYTTTSSIFDANNGTLLAQDTNDTIINRSKTQNVVMNFIEVANSNNLTIDNAEYLGMNIPNSQGISIADTSSNINVLNCHFVSLPSTPKAIGVHISGTNTTIDRCDISYTTIAILADAAHNTTVQNNRIYNTNELGVNFGFDPIPSGLVFYQSDTATARNNTLYNNYNTTSLYILASSNINTYNNEIFNSTYGILYGLISDNLSLNGDHLYNNQFDFFTNTSANSSLMTSGLIFDNPNGNYQNYSNLSITDQIYSDSYAISWVATPDPSSTGNLSVNNASINITSIDNMSIDQIVWTYSPDALNSTQQNSIKVWKYNGSWANLSSRVSVGSHRVTLQSITASGAYTLLYDTNGLNFSNLITLIPEATVALGVGAYIYYRSRRSSMMHIIGVI